jgi:excisionase family DNA binding protein
VSWAAPVFTHRRGSLYLYGVNVALPNSQDSALCGSLLSTFLFSPCGRLSFLPYFAAMTELLSTAEAAESLGVSVRRVRQLIDEGKLPARQVGRDYVIEPAALDGVRVYGKPGRPPKASTKKDVKKGGKK